MNAHPDPDLPWREWQAEHAAALRDLQDAQRAYHRLVASDAFTHNGALTGAQQDALARLDEARRRLDEVRSREPARS